LQNRQEHPAFPYLLLVLAIATWAGNFVVARYMRGEIPPLTLNFLRWSGAFVVLLPLCLGKFREDVGILKRHWKWLTLMAASGIVIFHSFVYTGLQTTTVLNAGLMMAVCPIIIPGIAYLIHRDRLTMRQSMGIVASVIGVVVIITRADPELLLSLSISTGDLWFLAAVPMWAFYSVIIKDKPQGLSSRAMMLAIAGVGSLMMLPLYLWELDRLGGVPINMATTVSVAYVSVVASVIAYFAWNKGVGDVGAIKAGPFLHLMPVFSALLAMIFLGERLEPFHFPGITLIVLGIVLTTWKGKVTS
jgi:drug/metabolite transporter (DMT)-like permease